MLTSLFVLILMIADTEKLSILSFWPSRFFPCRAPDCDLIRNSGSRISRQFSHICFQSIFIELDGTTEQTIEFWKIFNWAGWVAWLVAHLFASFPLKLSCYEYSDSQLGDGSHRVKLSSQPGRTESADDSSPPPPALLAPVVQSETAATASQSEKIIQ